jgi:hypothetical protein
MQALMSDYGSYSLPDSDTATALPLRPLSPFEFGLLLW